MNVLLFIIVLVGSFIIVRIGAIALQLTGLEWSLAKFQALSCFEKQFDLPAFFVNSGDFFN